MADEHHKGHINPKKKENIRIFVHRKRFTPNIARKSTTSQANSMEQLTSIIGKNLNLKKKNPQNNKNIIVVNYKPVFLNSRQSKTFPTSSNAPSTPPNTRRGSKTTLNRQSAPYNVPDVEDPLEFIEKMYQQLFTEDGQLRSDTEPAVLANCVKQIVTQSRRNSIAHRDSITTNIHQHKHSSPSSRFIRNIYNETDDINPLLQRNRTANTSRRSSKRSSMDNTDHHQQQQLHAFLNSYYHHQKRSSTIINKSHTPFSIDDTDNEDLDTFSDLNSYRKTLRNSPPASIDEDITLTDSKLLSSSGYQSLKSPHQIIQENNHQYCPNCVQIPSTISLIQPIREIFMKYLNFILISKNILLAPLFIFLLRQRPMHIGN